MNVNPEIHDPLMGFDKGWAWLRWKRVWHIVMAVALYVLYGLAVFAAVWLLCSCNSVKYVPVKEMHTEHHYRTDTIHKTDSVIDKQTTVIREVDSAMMAQYGIKLKNAERAWLIQNDRLCREIERLQAISAQADSVEDDKPTPIFVEKKLTRWQQVKIRLTDYILIAALILSMLYLLSRWLRRRSQR